MSGRYCCRFILNFGHLEKKMVSICIIILLYIYICVCVHLRQMMKVQYENIHPQGFPWFVVGFLASLMCFVYPPVNISAGRFLGLSRVQEVIVLVGLEAVLPNFRYPSQGETK